MESSRVVAVTDPAGRRRLWLGVMLLALGLLGHLLAAHAIGGSAMAYEHHIFGFFLLTTVCGVIIAGLGWRFWKGRHDITLLVLGAIQTLLGLIIYVMSAHGAIA